MIKKDRQFYNQQFTEQKYTSFLNDIINTYNHTPPFKISETPVFVPNVLKNKLVAACNEIMEVIHQPNFKELTEGGLFRARYKNTQ